MKRNPILVYIFEITNMLGCIIFPCMIFFNAGGWFFPKSTDMYAGTELLECFKSTAIAGGIFVVFIGIPLLLLIVDCFVIMKGVKGFKVSLVSIFSAPASYPVVRSAVLKSSKAENIFHGAVGSVIFISNCLVIASLAYYVIRIVLLSMQVL